MQKTVIIIVAVLITGCSLKNKDDIITKNKKHRNQYSTYQIEQTKNNTKIPAKYKNAFENELQDELSMQKSKNAELTIRYTFEKFEPGTQGLEYIPIFHIFGTGTSSYTINVKYYDKDKKIGEYSHQIDNINADGAKSDMENLSKKIIKHTEKYYSKITINNEYYWKIMNFKDKTE